MEELNKLRELTLALNAKEDEQEDVLSLLGFVADNTDGWFDWQVGSEDEFLSDNFKKQLGYEPHEMPNKVDSWRDIINQDDLTKVYVELDKHIQSKGEYPFKTVCRYSHKLGHEITILCRGKVIEYDGDEPKRFVGVHIDITGF